MSKTCLDKRSSDPGFCGGSSGDWLSAVDYSNMEYKVSHRPLRGFPAQYAVLGFLADAPAHGYALRTRIAEGLGPLWQIASSQLYQVLHKLAAAHWVSCDIDKQSQGPARKTYRLTAVGSAAFWEWASSPVANIRDLRVELLAKLYFLRRLAPTQVSNLVQRQLGVLQAIRRRVAQLESSVGDDGTIDSIWGDLRCRTIDMFTDWLEQHAEALDCPKERTS